MSLLLLAADASPDLDPWTIIALGAIIVAITVLSGWRGRQAGEDPQVILRRCKAELESLRYQLSQIPATREVHDALAEVDRTLHTVDETSAQGGYRLD